MAPILLQPAPPLGRWLLSLQPISSRRRSLAVLQRDSQGLLTPRCQEPIPILPRLRSDYPPCSTAGPIASDPHTPREPHVIQEPLIASLQASQEYFERSIGALPEEHSTFAPRDGMFTAAQLVAHVALSMDWFIDGAFSSDTGFNMNLEGDAKKIEAVTSLETAKTMLRNSYEAARTRIAGLSEEILESALPEGPVMGGLPRKSVVDGIVEHTSHHRGALTVYARLQSLTPPMPYADI